MKRLFTVFFVVVSSACLAQTRISGMVRDSHGDPLPGANVLLQDTYDGASSSGDGSFEFTSSEKGTKTLVMRFVGYKDFTKEINLAGNAIKIDGVLRETINELEAVTISAGAFNAGDASRRTILKAIDIATTAGATADIAAALNTLPGTQKVGESGRLFVRGGDSNEARTFIDGMVVLDAYGPSAPNTPSRGRFLPFMFKGTSFSTGGYSAEYGQALSSALVLDSKDKAESTRTDIGILSVGGDVAHTQVWDRGSVAGKIQYTNIRPYFGLINQEIDWKTPPASIEGVGAFRHQIGSNGLVKFYGNFNHSDFSLYNHNIDDYNTVYQYDLTNDYRYLNGSYQDVLSEKWNVRGGLSYTFVKNDSWLDDVRTNEIQKGLHAKIVFEGSLAEKVELKTGVEVLQRNYSWDTEVRDIPVMSGFNEIIPAGFAEVDLYASNRFVTRVGGRLEYNSMLQKASVDPRVSMACKTGNLGQIAFAYGRFRQSSRNDLLRVNNDLDPEKAEHFILNYQVIENRRTFRVESYYKRYYDLVKYYQGNPNELNNTGRGYAQGVELFWRDNQSLKNVDYWVSYSYLNTRRDYLDYPYKAVPSFASAHNFSLVYKHFVPIIKSQVGFTYSYTTGRPFNDPNSEKFNDGKTPNYSDLSFNMAYLPKPYLILYLSCSNLLGRDNIFGYEYSSVSNSEGVYNSRPIRQAAPRFLFVGIFITLSKDKSVNQLPSL